MNKNTKQKTGTQSVGEKKELKQLILKLTDEKAQEAFSDATLDKELEKHQLLNGKEITIKEIKDYIQNKARPYSPMFSLVYWREMFRIFNWPIAEANRFHKKREAALFNNEVIYGRFDKGVLIKLHILNPYTGYMTRHYKHFQFLTDEGIEKLALILDEAVQMMKDCTTYYEFRKKWFETYGVPYQLNFFGEDSIF